MYVEMWQGSQILLGRAEREMEGNYWVLMSTLLLTAFAFEAYLNHIGPTLFNDWHKLERHRSPLKKLDLVSEKLGMSFPPGVPPHESLRLLFKFRNDLAHGKNELLNTDELRDGDDNRDILLGEQPKTDWEKLITWPSVKQVRGDVEKVIRKLNAAADPDGDPFSSAISSHYSKLEGT